MSLQTSKLHVCRWTERQLLVLGSNCCRLSLTKASTNGVVALNVWYSTMGAISNICLVVDSGRPKESQVQSYSPGDANVPSWEGTLALPGQHNWTIHLLRQCSLVSNYFDHLLLLLLGSIAILCTYMRPVVTDRVAWSVCLPQQWALQEQLNRLRCRLGWGLFWVNGTMYYMVSRYPRGKGQFWG